MKLHHVRLALTLLGAGFLVSAQTFGGHFKRITIDGSFADWAGVPPAYTDAEDAPGLFDLKDIYVANDDQYLYVRVTLYAPANAAAYHHHVFLDADANPATGAGFVGVGSELLIEDGAGWQQKNGGFNEGAASDLDWASAPTGVLTEYEARISRQLRDAEGELVLTNDLIALAFEILDSSWSSREAAPGGEGILYEFAPTPPKATGTQTLLDLTAASWRVNDTGGDLGADWLAPDYDDTQAGWTGGTGLFGFGALAGTYPASIQTSLASGHTTYYLRAPFTWDHDTLGLALPADLYLSDGAVVYLNGVEVRRLRLPGGPIGSNTAATGGPAQPGQAEHHVLPSSALVVGQNVLAVEVHQDSATPNDLAFGMTLTATDNLPPAIEDPTQPADREVEEGEATIFSVGSVSGTEPLSYQWFKDGVPIDGATSPTLTLPVVLFGDAGAYHVEITNPTGVSVASRAAVLTTSAVPVSLSDPAEPADRTITEGESTTFALAIAGSPPLSYQWFKDGTPIDGATAAELTLSNATLADAGDYSATVSNRLNGVTSRAAHLAVLRDSLPPTIIQLSGSGRVVTVQFSEPLDPVTAAETARYTLSGNMGLQAANLDPVDPHVVTLSTSSPLPFGSVYRLTVNGVKDRFGNAAQASAPLRATIRVDGDFEDWAGIEPAATEPQDTPEGQEFQNIYVVNDDDYLYVRFSFFANVGQLPVDAYFHIFADTDNDPGTGFPTAGVGSEMMIENGTGYQQKGGAFNEGGVSGLDFAIGPAAQAADFECRISRRAVFESDGQPLFANDTIALVLQLISGTWALLDTAPQGGGLVYTFQPVAPLRLGALAVRRAGNQLEISWTGSGVLESRDSLTSGAWAPVQNATSPHLVDPTAQRQYFRLSQ